jgi:hypothetical protein
LILTKYVLTDYINTWRFICLFISISSCFFIIVRRAKTIKIRNFQYLLKIKSKSNIFIYKNIILVNEGRFVEINLIIKCLIHLILPYPYLQISAEFLSLGYSTYISSTIILNSLAFIRMFTAIKLLLNIVSNYWFPSEYVLGLWSIKNIYWFYYKLCLRRHSIIWTGLHFIWTFLIFSFLYRLYEHYKSVDTSILESMWYVMNTMATCKKYYIY